MFSEEKMKILILVLVTLSVNGYASCIGRSGYCKNDKNKQVPCFQRTCFYVQGLIYNRFWVCDEGLLAKFQSKDGVDQDKSFVSVESFMEGEVDLPFEIVLKEINSEKKRKFIFVKDIEMPEDEESYIKSMCSNNFITEDNLMVLLNAYSLIIEKDVQALDKFKKLYDIYEEIRKSDSGDGKITYGLGFLFKKLLIANSVDIPLNGIYSQNQKIDGKWQNINCIKYKKLTGDKKKCGEWLPKESQIMKLVEYSAKNKNFKSDILYILKKEESKWLKKYFNFSCSLQEGSNDAEKKFIRSLCN